MAEVDVIVRPLERDDRKWVADFLDKHWGSTQMVTRGRLFLGHLLPGFVAERPVVAQVAETEESEDETAPHPAVKMERVGLLTYNIEGGECEIISLDSLIENEGIGTALLNRLKQTMKEAGIRRLWLITTNDNLPALRFWQKRDFVLVQIHRNAVEQARRLKPQIPITGHAGIPIRDEIEMEYML